MLIGLAVLVPPDGQERGDLLQFFGKFHPLAVHLPIALMLLVPVLEIAGRNLRRRPLRVAAGFVLGLAAGFLRASSRAARTTCRNPADSPR